MEYIETTIHSLQEFLAWVQDTYKITASDGEGHTSTCTYNKVYYRGQENKEWELTPGVFRKEKRTSDKKKSTNIVHEHNILREANLRLWSETQTFHSYLEKLVFFQHYGLKTRLLDVTFNPLIALYMACATLKETGAVYYGYSCEDYDLKTAELTAEILFTRGNNESINKFFSEKRELKGQDFSKPIFIWPPVNNPRVEAQDGAFIMAPLLKPKYGGGYTKNLDSLDDSGFFRNARAIIPQECKEGILKELSRIGINIGSIYKGVTEKLQAIMLEDGWKSLEGIDLSNLNITD